MHGSLLPKFRGRAPVNWAVLKGETQTGATLHVMTQRADRGADRGPGGRCRSAPTTRRSRCSSASPPRPSRSSRGGSTISSAGTARRGPQDESRPPASAAARPRTAASTGRRPRSEVHDLVRAVTHPYPGRVHGRLRRKDVRLAHAALPGLAGARHLSGPGPRRGRTASSSRAATTATSSCSRLQREGGRKMDAAQLSSNGGGAHEGPHPRRQRLHRQRADRAHPRSTTDWDVSGLDIGSDKIAPVPLDIRASRTSRATSRSTRSGSSTRSRSATSCCRSSRSRRRPPT